MSVTLRDLLKALYPGRTPKPNEYMPRLEAAVNALDSQQIKEFQKARFFEPAILEA